MDKVSRNDLCPCGSGKKFKKCCITKRGLQKHTVSVLSGSQSGEEPKAKKVSSSLFQKTTQEKVAPTSTTENPS